MGAFVLMLLSLILFSASVLSVINDQGWEVIRETYLIGVGSLFISYVLYRIAKYKALTPYDSNQELKDSRRKLKEEIKRQKKKIKVS